jgi:hypothetical protein
MPRKTTAHSLARLTCGHPQIDILGRSLLMKIANGSILLLAQPEYDDEEFVFSEFYGTYKDIGITVQRKKKIRGINPHYYLIIEIDSEPEPVTLSGAFGGKAWGLAQVQNRNPANASRFADGTIDHLIESLGLDDDHNIIHD